MITFSVRGIPVPQGNMTAFADGAGVAHVTHKHSGTLKDWRCAIGAAARDAMRGRSTLTGAVGVDLYFAFPRPKSHFRTNGLLKPNAPKYVTKTPDGDKIERAAWDALTGVVYVDDKQIASWSGTKQYAAEPGGVTGVRVIIRELVEGAA